MNSTSFNIENNTITFTNSASGHETVLVNGTVVSEKFSWFGTSHNFTVDINGTTEDFTVKSSISLRHNIVVKLYKNDAFIKEGYLSFSFGFDANTSKNTYLVLGMVYLILGFALSDNNSVFFSLGGVFFVIGLSQSNKETCKKEGEEDIKRLH